MTLEEMRARLTALIQGRADGSNFTDEEATEIESLEANITAATAAAQRSEAIRARHAAPAPDAPRPASPRLEVSEGLPYRIQRVRNALTNRIDYQFGGDTEHQFGADLAAMFRSRDTEGETPAGRRVMAAIRHELRPFNADVQSDDINELNPSIYRADMFVDQRDYRYPIMELIGRGAPPNGIQPFRFPRFSSATGLVGDHTEGTEPASGTYVSTEQPVTPTAISGKASITREVWDMVGNPAVTGLIYGQMVRGYREALESSAATFLNTLTTAADFTVTTASVNKAFAASLEGNLAELPFARGYNFDGFVMEKVIYKTAAAAVDDNGRPIYPILAPSNANGQAASRFRTIDIAGLLGIPSWALASTPGAANNSWIFDSATMFGWNTEPQRLEFPGTDQSDGSYAPVAFVDLAIWGYKAFANSDIGGVRQVIYDSVS